MHVKAESLDEVVAAIAQLEDHNGLLAPAYTEHFRRASALNGPVAAAKGGKKPKTSKKSREFFFRPSFLVPPRLSKSDERNLPDKTATMCGFPGCSNTESKGGPKFKKCSKCISIAYCSRE